MVRKVTSTLLFLCLLAACGKGIAPSSVEVPAGAFGPPLAGDTPDDPPGAVFPVVSPQPGAPRPRIVTPMTMTPGG